MKAGSITEIIKELKNTAVRKQMYEIGCNLRDVERELSFNYIFEDEIEVSHLYSLLQRCLDGVPDNQKVLLTQIIRELKLNQIL